MQPTVTVLILRFVRLTLDPSKREDFLTLFDGSSASIRAFDGCLELLLLQDTRYPNIFTTLSKWSSEDALNEYRSSPLFIDTWARTKPMFASPAVAFSYAVVRGPL